MMIQTMCRSMLTVGFSLSLVCSAAAQKTSNNRPSTQLPDNVRQELDVVYASYGQRQMKLDLFLPKQGGGEFPALVVVHGGGWLNGDKTKFHALAMTLASRGYVTAAISYRLGGEAIFPAAIHDCNAAVRFLRANAKKYRVDPQRIGAVGGSAGGHLVGLMATAPHVKDFQGDSGNPELSSRLQAAIVLAGPLELASGPVAERSRRDPEKSNSNKWLGKTIDEAPELYRKASPLTHVNQNTPPILFMAGEFDNPKRNAATRAKLKSLNIRTGIIVVAGAKHGCWNRNPWFALMVTDMDNFFRETLR